MLSAKRPLAHAFIDQHDLFIVLQSGSSLGWWAYKQDPDGIAFRLAKELGWGESDMKNTKDLKQFLTAVPQDKGHFTSFLNHLH